MCSVHASHASHAVSPGVLCVYVGRSSNQNHFKQLVDLCWIWGQLSFFVPAVFFVIENMYV